MYVRVSFREELQRVLGCTGHEKRAHLGEGRGLTPLRPSALLCLLFSSIAGKEMNCK